jgi:hypothetical protein
MPACILCEAFEVGPYAALLLGTAALSERRRPVPSQSHCRSPQVACVIEFHIPLSDIEAEHVEHGEGSVDQFVVFFVEVVPAIGSRDQVRQPSARSLYTQAADE